MSTLRALVDGLVIGFGFAIGAGCFEWLRERMNRK